MTLIERIRFRLRMLAYALHRGWTLKPIAGADGEGEGEPEPKGNDEPEEKGGTGEEEPLDLDRAKAKIAKANSEAANLRKRLKELEPLAKKAQELEDASKSEQEKLTERAAKAEETAKEATQEVMRLRVALRKGLTETQAKRLVGETEEELEQDADELLASFTPPEGEGDAPRRPRERLRPGAVPSSEPEETDPRKLAEDLPRY